MLERRGIIHMGGSPGSGKSRLASTLANALETEAGIVTEHLSLGNRLRHIGRGVIDSVYREEIAAHLSDPSLAASKLRTEVVEHVLLDAIEDSNRKDIDVVLLDGFPRTPEQVETLRFLSIITERALMGSITTVIDQDTALARIMKRSRDHADRRMDHATARRKLANYYENDPPTLAALHEVLPPQSMYYVTSNLAPTHTAELGYKAALEIIHRYDENASSD